MTRETMLNHLRQKNFDEIIKILRDNKTFNVLLDDKIFKTVFFENFTKEFLNQPDLEITYPVFLYQCHISKDFIFEFNIEDLDKILKYLIEKTKDYNYAKLLPNYTTSVEIIREYELNQKNKIEKYQRETKKYQDFEIVEKYSNNTEYIVKSIFNSPQEKEFYLACKQIFKNYLVLPNVSLTTLFNQNVVKEKFSDYFYFYLTSSIDFVVVDDETFIPILFFELDSKTYHTSENAKRRDEIKNILVTELGSNLLRITKKTGKEGVNEYKSILKKIKKEKKII